MRHCNVGTECGDGTEKGAPSVVAATLLLTLPCTPLRRYETFPGGVGIADKVFENIEEIWRRAGEKKPNH